MSGDTANQHLNILYQQIRHALLVKTVDIAHMVFMWAVYPTYFSIVLWGVILVLLTSKTFLFIGWTLLRGLPRESLKQLNIVQLFLLVYSLPSSLFFGTRAFILHPPRRFLRESAGQYFIGNLGFITVLALLDTTINILYNSGIKLRVWIILTLLFFSLIWVTRRRELVITQRYNEAVARTKWIRATASMRNTCSLSSQMLFG